MAVLDVNVNFPYAGLGLMGLITLNFVVLFVWKLTLIAKRRIAGGGAVGGDEENNNNNNSSGVSGSISPVLEENYDCPICLEVKPEMIYSSCAHVFCETCIIAHWRATSHPLKCDCPLCRRTITTIFPFNRGVSPEVAEYNGVGGNGAGREDDTNTTAACTPYSYFRDFLINMRDTIYESPLLLRSLISFIFSGRNVRANISLLIMTWKVVRWIPYVIGCIVYILLPGDFFAEERYGYLGYLDDGLAFYILLLIVLGIYRTTILTVHRRDH